jgi:shikimate kinase
VTRRDHRPLLHGKDPAEVLERLAEARRPIYAKAHIHIRSESVPHERAVDMIVRALTERERQA